MGLNSPEINNIIDAVKTYNEAHYYADLVKFNKVFHPKCYTVGHYEGAVEHILRDEYADWIKKEKVPAEIGDENNIKISSIDVSGSAAMVKIVDEYLGYIYTDYLSMLKIDNEWVIVNKLYNVEGKVKDKS